MPNTRIFQQSFAGGEVSPFMHLRASDSRTRSGAARMRNMVATPTGAAVRRSGTRFIRETKDSATRSVIRKFAVSPTEQLAIEIGVGYFRFHTDAETVTYATPRIISSINTGTEAITFTAAHGFTAGDEVRFLYGTGASLPAAAPALLDDTTYYIKSVISSTSVTISDSLGGPEINFSGQATGTVALIDLADASTPYDESVVTLNGLTDVVTFSETHLFFNDDPVTLTTTGTLPTGLSEDTIYYVRDRVGSGIGSTCTLAATLGGSVIPFTGNGTGTITMFHVYPIGTLVHKAGDGVYYAKEDMQSGDPATWHLLPLPADDCVYEAPNDYLESELPYLKFRQQGQVMTITHQWHAPLQLTRNGVADWEARPISSFGASIDAPVISSVTRTFGEYWSVQLGAAPSYTWTVQNASRHTLGPGDAVYIEGSIGAGSGVTGSIGAGVYIVSEAPSGATTFTLRTLAGVAVQNSGVAANGVVRRISASADTSETYVVAAITETGEETEPSAEASASYNPLYVSGSSNTVNWTAVTGAARYRVYKKQTGIFGFIGDTETTSFKDDNITPDLSITPVRYDDTLDFPERPGCSTYFEQRVVYSGARLSTQQIWLTRTGSESTLTYHLPVVDTDRINFTLATPESCTVQHVVPQSNLLVLTDTAEFVVTPVNTDAITPTSFRARPVSYIGSSHVAPLRTNNSLLFCAARGGHVRELGRVAEEGYATDDVSLRAAHLFDGKTINDAALMKAPYPIAWFINSDGYLLGFTYAREEDLGGWHWHDTQGVFESLCSVAEGSEDALYFIVRRTIDGNTKRYVERMEPFALPARGREWYVDCGLIYDSVDTTTITGLGHLEAETIQVYAAGSTRTETIVSGGAAAIDTSVVLAVLGLGYPSELQTLPVLVQIDQAFGRGRTHNVNKLWVRVADSYRFEAGPAGDLLVPSMDIDEDDIVDEIDIDVHIPGDWTDTGRVLIQQTDPVPLTVVALCAEVSIGS